MPRIRSRLRRSRLYCSFCRKGDAAVEKLIGGPGVYICDACVGLCNDILANHPAPAFGGWHSLSDRELLRALRPAVAAVEGAESVLHEQVRILRSRGVTWQRIGKALGVSRQAAWERFARTA